MEKKNSKNPSLSIVLPVFEEADLIQGLIEGIFGVLQDEYSELEVVVVDDGSEDGTTEVLKQLKREYGDVLVVARHLINRGNGAALRTGINIARGEIVVTMDADGQHSPDDIPNLLAQIPPYDLIIGARLEDYEGGWYRNAANGFYNRFASWLSRREIKDLTSGFRAMRRDVVRHFLPLFPQGFSAPTTTTLAFIKGGYNVGFLPIHVQQRKAGKSKIRIFEDGSRFILIIIRMVMLYDPLRIFIPAGVALFLLGCMAWGAGLVNAGRLVFPNSAIFLYSAAMLIWLLGLIADQLANTRISYHGDEIVNLLNQDQSQ
ncbi:MAG: glycosyltransferase family 2 protein [Anaerolineales bacterium]|nr:glycosyltransferase family 2 protein [Anaerolineales bacterium]